MEASEGLYKVIQSSNIPNYKRASIEDFDRVTEALAMDASVDPDLQRYLDMVKNADLEMRKCLMITKSQYEGATDDCHKDFLKRI